MSILGIDPGKQGALVFIGEYETKAYPMPLLEDGKVDVGKMQSLIIFHDVTFAVIERQQIRSGQKGAMAIGENYGRLTATLALCGITYADPTPQKWQKYFKVSGDKAEHVQCCLENGYDVPKKSDRVNSPPHDGIADAYLIALYGKLNETTRT